MSYNKCPGLFYNFNFYFDILNLAKIKNSVKLNKPFGPGPGNICPKGCYALPLLLIYRYILRTLYYVPFLRSKTPLWGRGSRAAPEGAKGPLGVSLYITSRLPLRLSALWAYIAARRTARAHLCPPEGAKADKEVGVSSSPKGSVAPLAFSPLGIYCASFGPPLGRSAPASGT